ncbi:MAG: M15 family metallopeptidase, partial [Bacilli bacterium]|nr:M15 family metallopeptidase [Bacilli bacterium]
RNSEDLRLVARNDKEETLFNFLTKKANREKNYAYYYYIPAATWEDKDEDGTKETRTCNPAVPKSYNDFAELSISDWQNMENGVYFWNLLDSFVEDYYSEYLDKATGYAEVGSERYEAAAKLIDNIYDLYTIMGPSRDCSELYAYQSISNMCTDGVTVVGNHAGTYDLEEYIAGVVEAEMYADFPMESKRALAVAARSYVLASTNQCEQAIDNSSNAQNFNPNYSQESWEAADSTRGEVITYDGRVILAQYDSWNCPGRYSCDYKKLPSEEVHTVTISNKYASRAAGGHGRGMSQIAAADMASNGSSYRNILSYFYTGSLAIAGGGSGEAVKNGSTNEKLAFLFPDGIPTSSGEMQKYLTTVSVPLVNINGATRTATLTVHQAVANDVVNIFTEIANSGFPIKDAYCYSWRGMAGNRQTTSHHSYGVACDINANENYMIRNGSVISGSFWKPGDSPYSIEPNGPVVQAFANYGWSWGGSWSNSKDYMHFSFTGQ